MTIGNKSLTVLVGLTLVLLVTTIVVMTHKSSPAGAFEKDSLLIQGLDMPLISQIKVAAEGKHVTLTKQEEQYVVADRENYAAATREINGLLLKVLEIRRHELVSDSADAHKELGVLDDGKTTKVELMGKDGKSLACVLVGSAKNGGNYVRLKNENAVYAAKEGIWGITADPASYLRKQLIDTPKDDIVSVTVATPAGTYKIARDAEGKPQLQAVPAGKRVKQAFDVEDVFGALTSLDFEDATRRAEGIVWTGAYTCKLKSPLSYVLRVGMLAGKQYITAQAVGPSREELEKLTLAPDESKAELAKKEVLLKANQAATVFNARHKDWVYQLGDKAKSLSRQITDLVEDIPPATKPATAPTSATAPAAPTAKPK